jgi:hypothetical protein
MASGLLLSACTVQAPVDVNATAVALARSWATQTAEAKPVDVYATAVALAGSWATQTAEAQPAASATNTEAPATSARTDTATPVKEPTATPTLTPIPEPILTSTLTPPPTLTQTVIPKPTATRTATTAPPPTCPVAVDAALASGWNYAALGCPKAEASIVWSAWQSFLHGYMIWMEDSDWTYALQYLGGTDGRKGEWVTGGNGWRWDGSFPDGHGLTPPEGLVEPIRGFGFVWYSKLGGPSSQIGWGTAEEKGFCAVVQRFEKGMLVQSTAASGCGGGQFNWATTSDFKPVFIALYGDGRWRRF